MSDTNQPPRRLADNLREIGERAQREGYNRAVVVLVSSSSEKESVVTLSVGSRRISEVLGYLRMAEQGVMDGHLHPCEITSDARGEGDGR